VLAESAQPGAAGVRTRLGVENQGRAIVHSAEPLHLQF